MVVGIGMLAAACCPPPSGNPNPTTTLPTGPAITGEACPPDSGVTVVVDSTALDDSIRIGCAEGPQATGLAALAAAGFAVGSESGAGTVCTIDSLPTEGFPFCWLTGGFWGYWKSPDRSTPWDYSQVGAGSGPLVEGSIEGWAWAPDFDDAAPRVAPADLAQHTRGARCAVPDAPVLSIIASSETLPFTIPGDGPIEVAALPADDDAAGAEYVEADTLALSGFSGPTRVLARSASEDCAVVDTFEAVYDVQPTYSGRPGIAGNTSPAIPVASASVLGWASGHSDYTPGTDLTANWQVPENAYGSAASGLLPLGNGGQVTLTFDNPITDGEGYDLAVFENGFYQNATSELLFPEYGYVEVSSNGVDFVRFDSASSWSTPVAAFGFADPRQVGGLAGKDGAGFGTPFDLSGLSNQAAVRSGVVDIGAITHVRIVDVVGGAAWPNAGDNHVDPDSFGRTIFDAFRTTGSGGYDLTGIAVLNAASA